MEMLVNNENGLKYWELEATLGQPINEIVGDESFGEGAISAGEQTEESIEDLVEAVKRHLVRVSSDAPCGCIDGRACVHTMAGGETSVRPSVAGGPVTAYAATEMIGWHGNDISDTATRFQTVNDRLNAAGLPTGSHIDTAAEIAKLGGNRTGCGADDKAQQNIDNIYTKSPSVTVLCTALLGEKFNATSMQFRNQTEVSEQMNDWDPTIVVDAISKRDPSAVEVLESDETPTYGHNEIFVVFNNVEGASIDRDALVAETGKQVFVVDMWYIDKMARGLAEGPQADDQYQSLLHAMVAYQIGTYISLCDGSQRPLIISEAA